MPPSRKQRIQKALAWKLFVVKGAQGTLYPRETYLPDEIRIELQLIAHHLKHVETQLRRSLRNIK